MLVHSLASKYARFVVLGRPMYWTPRSDHWTPPLLKSDDLFFREPRDIGPPFQKSWTRPCKLTLRMYRDEKLKELEKIKMTRKQPFGNWKLAYISIFGRTIHPQQHW